MTGILALLGSGEFTPKAVDIDKYLLSKISSPKIAILPTAAGQEKDYRKWIEMGIKHFKKLGVKADGVPLITKANANDPKFVEKLSGFNFFYFSGGNPGYILKVLKGSLCWRFIFDKYKKGATLAGSSAGAMVMGSRVWSAVYDFVDKGKIIPWTNGLAVVDFGIIPHFDLVKKEFTNDQINKMKENLPKEVKVVGIDEDTAYVKENEKWIIVGRGTITSPL